jgi:5'-3' exoribonuclease 1
MGIPKFYRWLSERYPLINQRIYDTTFLPPVDNLYLDMNGILHNCSHANGAIEATSDKEVLQAVFFYLDRIVHIVRPEKLMYMAIDGVAPRAKMNQQRSRRFRSAKDAAIAAQEKRQRGEEVPVDAFDSNCITPGTEWMARMSANIKYFIKRKIKEDPIWRRFKIIFSGHEIPGEGEHKIIGYIRNMKMQRNYDPNTRHVMYGLDADLVMLSLLSHDPHFSLLREVVDFQSFRRKENTTKQMKKQIYQQAWQLLHISTVREYLNLEFSNIELDGFQYDLERVIDDVILLCIFVGNDFLPHLPSLDIAESAIDVMFTMYKEELPKMGGYLSDGGNIHINRLERMMKLLGAREEEVFSSRLSKIDKQSRSKRYQGAKAVVPDWLQNSNVKGSAGVSATKMAYYHEKFGIETGAAATEQDKTYHHRIVKSYLEGLEWVLQYYYNGVCSWNWFYPFHYAPMASDMLELGEIHSTIKFSLGKPFLPFQQLLGCLPPASSRFLPPSYRALMTMEDSPIIDFYPTDFHVDMNGKRNPWEGVNLLSFINEKRLKAAIAARAPLEGLTDEERARNKIGLDYLFQYDVTVQDTAVAAHGNKEAFPDVVACQTKVKVFKLPRIQTAGGRFVARLCRGVKLPYPGYPCLRSFPVLQTALRPVELNVFGSPSRKATLCIVPTRPTETEAACGGVVQGPMRVAVQVSAAAKALLGRHVYVGFPHLREACVYSVSDRREEHKLNPNGTARVKQHMGDASSMWQQLARGLQSKTLRGALEPGTGGLDVGEVTIVVHVKPLLTMNRNPDDGSTTRVFEDETVAFPLQTVFINHPAPDPRFKESAPQTAVDRFPQDAGVVCISQRAIDGASGYGCTGVVKGHNPQTNTVDVALTIEPKEKPFGKIIYQKVTEKYFSSHAASKALQLTASALGRVMGSIIVMPGRVDIGLNFKVFGNLCLPGYARPVKIPAAKSGKAAGNVWSSGKGSAKMLFHGGKDPSEADTKGRYNNNRSGGSGGQSERVRWEYSERAIQVVATYKKKFKRVFTTLLAKPEASKFDQKDIAPKQEDFEALCRWLQQLQTYKQPLVPHTSETMCHNAVRTVEAAATKQRATSLSERKTVLVKGLLPTELYKPDVEGFANAGKGPGTDLNKPPALGDRIVNIRCPFVPLGLRGTVVSIHPSTGCVEGLFDSEFIGGQDLNGLCARGRGRLLKWSEVLSLSKPEKVAAPKPAKKAPKAAVPKAAAPKKGPATPATKKPNKKPARNNDNLSMLLQKAGITVEQKMKNSPTVFHEPQMFHSPNPASMPMPPPPQAMAMMAPRPVVPPPQVMAMMAPRPVVPPPQMMMPRGLAMPMPMGKKIEVRQPAPSQTKENVKSKRVPREKKKSSGSSSLTPGHMIFKSKSTPAKKE